MSLREILFYGCPGLWLRASFRGGFYLASEEVAEEGPGGEKEGPGEDGRGAEEDAVEARQAAAVGFHYHHQNYYGESQEQEGVVAPGGGDVAVQQGVEHALAAAAGAIVARQRLNHAFGRPRRFRRVHEKTVGCARYERNRYHYQVYQALMVQWRRIFVGGRDGPGHVRRSVNLFFVCQEHRRMRPSGRGRAKARPDISRRA